MHADVQWPPLSVALSAADSLEDSGQHYFIADQQEWASKNAPKKESERLTKKKKKTAAFKCPSGRT